MFVYTFSMLAELTRHLQHRAPADTTRHGLVAEIEAVAAIRAALDAYEHRVVVAIDALGDKGLDAAGVLRSVARVSSRSATRVSATASLMGGLPVTSEALATGAITSEHANLIADAAKRLGSDVVDTALAAMATQAPADLFAKRSRQWVASHTSDASAAERQQRLLSDRSLKSWARNDGMRVWLAELDPVTAASVSARLDTEYDRLWHLDGGRGPHPTDASHPAGPEIATTRTPQQRMADAFVGLITGRCATGQPNEPDHPGENRQRTVSAPAHVRHQMLAVVDLARMRTGEPHGQAQLIDGTPLPQAVVERLACISDISGIIFDDPGKPIWVGRTRRSATDSQWRALIARDRGCVGCGADTNRCEAHHLQTWNSGGSTDITNLVLVCSHCHHNIHDRGMRLTRTASGWRISARAGPTHQTFAA